MAMDVADLLPTRRVAYTLQHVFQDTPSILSEGQQYNMLPDLLFETGQHHTNQLPLRSIRFDCRDYNEGTHTIYLNPSMKPIYTVGYGTNLHQVTGDHVADCGLPTVITCKTDVCKALDLFTKTIFPCLGMTSFDTVAVQYFDKNANEEQKRRVTSSSGRLFSQDCVGVLVCGPSLKPLTVCVECKARAPTSRMVSRVCANCDDMQQEVASCQLPVLIDGFNVEALKLYSDHADEKERDWITLILDHLQRQRKAGQRLPYPQSIMDACRSLYLRSASGYKHTRSTLPLLLPHPNTLNQHSEHETGLYLMSSCIKAFDTDLKLIAESLDCPPAVVRRLQRFIVVGFDEVTVKSNGELRLRTGEVLGLVANDVAGQLFSSTFQIKLEEKGERLATHVMVVTARSIQFASRGVVAVIPTDSMSSASHIGELLAPIQSMLRAHGFGIAATSCDLLSKQFTWLCYDEDGSETKKQLVELGKLLQEEKRASSPAVATPSAPTEHAPKTKIDTSPAPGSFENDAVCAHEDCSQEKGNIWMIECSHCSLWYHFACVGLDHANDVVSSSRAWRCPKARCQHLYRLCGAETIQRPVALPDATHCTKLLRCCLGKGIALVKGGNIVGAEDLRYLKGCLNDVSISDGHVPYLSEKMLSEAACRPARGGFDSMRVDAARMMVDPELATTALAELKPEQLAKIQTWVNFVRQVEVLHFMTQGRRRITRDNWPEVQAKIEKLGKFAKDQLALIKEGVAESITLPLAKALVRLTKGWLILIPQSFATRDQILDECNVSEDLAARLEIEINPLRFTTDYVEDVNGQLRQEAGTRKKLTVAQAQHAAKKINLKRADSVHNKKKREEAKIAAIKTATWRGVRQKSALTPVANDTKRRRVIAGVQAVGVENVAK